MDEKMNLGRFPYMVLFVALYHDDQGSLRYI